MKTTSKKRGRPKGSKNKPKNKPKIIPTTTESKVIPMITGDVIPKKRGRPKGSKNKTSTLLNPSVHILKSSSEPKPATKKTTAKIHKLKTKSETRGQKCYAEGQNAEKRFLELAKENNWKLVRQATKEEDMESHWDYMFKTPEGDEVTVDIKNMKKRHKKWTNRVLVEFRTVHRRGTNNSMSGWIHGKADYIAFRMFDYKTNDFDCFLLIDREKLKIHATQMVMGGQAKVEGRDGRGDKYVYLPVVNLIERGYIAHIFGANRFVFPKIMSLGE